MHHSIESELAHELRLIDFLNLIGAASKDLAGEEYLLVPGSLMDKASKTTKETIFYSIDHGFVIEEKKGQSTEYRLTAKGISFRVSGE